MPYTPFQDGTQAFAIPDSPLTIDSVAYIAEDISLNAPQNVVEIKDPNGVPIGQTFIPQVITGSAKLQLASAATAMPARQKIFTLQGANWVVENVSPSYTQGNYVYANITFRQKINA